MKEPKTLLARELEYFRHEKYYSQEKMAELIGISFKSYYNHIKSEYFPSGKHLKLYQKLLGWTSSDIAAMRADYSAYRGQNQKEFTVKSFDELLKGGLEINSLWNAMVKILDKFPLPDDEGNDMGSKEKWCRIYDLSPDTGYALLHHSEGIVGFWYVVAVTEEVYERILEGENINREIDTCDIRVFDMEGDYDLYLVDFFRTSETIVARRCMLRKFMEFLESLALQDIYIKRIAANVTSYIAQNSCKSHGFKYIAEHKYHTMYGKDNLPIPTKIYELNLKESLGKLSFETSDKLKPLYQFHFGKRK